MIAFQVKGQSNRLSTLKGKEKDVINFFTYSTKYTKDTEALGRQLSQARSKPDPVNLIPVGKTTRCVIKSQYTHCAHS